MLVETAHHPYVLRSPACSWIKHCDTWLVKRQTYGYLPSHRALLVCVWVVSACVCVCVCLWLIVWHAACIVDWSQMSRMCWPHTHTHTHTHSLSVCLCDAVISVKLNVTCSGKLLVTVWMLSLFNATKWLLCYIEILTSCTWNRGICDQQPAPGNGVSHWLLVILWAFCTDYILCLYTFTIQLDVCHSYQPCDAVSTCLSTIIFK